MDDAHASQQCGTAMSVARAPDIKAAATFMSVCHAVLSYPHLRTKGLWWNSCGCLLRLQQGSCPCSARSAIGLQPLLSLRLYQPCVLRYPMVPSGLVYCLHPSATAALQQPCVTPFHTSMHHLLVCMAANHMPALDTSNSLHRRTVCQLTVVAAGSNWWLLIKYMVMCQTPT